MWTFLISARNLEVRGRLQSFLALNQLAAFPDNPDEIAVRTYSTVAVLAHETAHRWLAYPLFKLGTTNSGDLLGYQQAHWSYFFNADASLMEGHVISDNGNGSFTITEATTRFGKLDQYLMGLRSAADVGPLFYVKPSAGSGHVADDVTEPSDIGLTFNGTRADLTVYDIIAAEGAENPGCRFGSKGNSSGLNFAGTPGHLPHGCRAQISCLECSNTYNSFSPKRLKVWEPSTRH